MEPNVDRPNNDRERITRLVGELTLDEKVLLTHGADMWSTAAIERVGIPSIIVTDGPNGARGGHDPMSAHTLATSMCLPCGSALGATWDPELIENVGGLIGREARAKGCRVLLAPTVNIHRSPLGGRNFECYSEDPLLSGRIAAAFVRGVQAQGVVTTVKHFAGNDAEFERYTINSIIDERTLREITLVPFELAVTEGGALGIMTAYNRLNGPYCSEHHELLQTVLRDEWGFEGFVISDWFSAGSTIGSATAGLDLEMPGPGRFFGPALADAVRDGLLDESVVDAQVTRLLMTLARVGALADGSAGTSPTPLAINTPEDRSLTRRAAAESIVLLRNDRNLLPLDPSHAPRRLAVIGPNADVVHIGGGGSAQVSPHETTTILAALRERLAATTEIVFASGPDITRFAPPIKCRLAGQLLDGDGHVLRELTSDDGRLFVDPHTRDGRQAATARFEGQFVPASTGRHELSLIQIGPARVSIDNTVLLDGIAHPPRRGVTFFGIGSHEMRTSIDLEAGQTYTITLDYIIEAGAVIQGVIVGHRPPRSGNPMREAVEAAASADTTIVVVGTDNDWESEGYDRDSLHLPAPQDELISSVAAVCANTIVVVNTGSPIAMPWVNGVGAIVQAWLGGEEMGHAVADVLVGVAEPAGRLPTTFPARIEDSPSFGNFPGELGEVRYGEGLLVGYRGFDTRHVAPLFPFGGGLSYTTFAWSEPVRRGDAPTMSVEITVTNTGARRGAEVVQAYVAPIDARVQRPPRELKAFGKCWLDAGESTTITLTFDERSFAYWHPGHRLSDDVRERARIVPMALRPDASSAPAGWRVDPGRYEIQLGRSSRDILHTIEVTITG